MAIDSQQIGTFAMEFMDQLREQYGDEAELQTLLVVAAIGAGEDAKLELRAMDADGGSVPSWTLKGIASTVADNF
jgi:hypothetical protein